MTEQLLVWAALYVQTTYRARLLSYFFV